MLQQRGVVAGEGGTLAIASPIRPSGLDQRVLASPAPPCQTDTSTALAGVRVLEVGLLTAGPFAGRLLADLGAEVIKLEVPGRGDLARAVGPTRKDAAGSNYFHTVAAGKRSLALDLRQAEDLELALHMAESSDVVLENLGPGVLADWGFGAAAIHAGQPRRRALHGQRVRSSRARRSAAAPTTGSSRPARGSWTSFAVRVAHRRRSVSHSPIRSAPCSPPSPSWPR